MIPRLRYHDITAMTAVIQTVITQRVKMRRKSSACVTSVMRRCQSKCRRMVYAMGGASTVSDDRDTWYVQLRIQTRRLTTYLTHGVRSVINMSLQSHCPTDHAMDLADFVVQGLFITSVTQQYHTQDNLQPELHNGIRIRHMQERRKEHGWGSIYHLMKHIR